MEKIKLKPCPFCGRKAQTFCTPEREYRDGEKLVAVYPKVFNAYCICGQAKAKAATAEKAAEKWNRRAPEWFSVDKVLPEDEDKKAYLVKVGGNVTIAEYHGDGEWMTYSLCNVTRLVTHWQPLPEAPLTEVEDETD